MTAISQPDRPLATIRSTSPLDLAEGSGDLRLRLAGASFLALSAMLMVAEGMLAQQSGGAPKLDFIRPFDPQVYLETMARYGDAGRSTFFWTLWIDMVFPFTVVWFAARLLRATTRRWRIGIVAPIAFLVLDLLENVSFLRMLAGFPAAPDTTTAVLGSSLTTAKLLALAVTYLEMLGCLAALAWKDRARLLDLGLALAATGGTALCLYLAPIQSTIWNAPELTPMVAATPWVASALGAHDGGLTPYYAFGRLVVWVYLGLGAGFFAARRRPIGGPGSERRLADERAFQVLIALLVVAAVGNVVEYWGGSLYGEAVKEIGFRFLETPALALAGLASAWLGARLVRSAAGSDHRIAWLFGLTLPAMLLSTILLRYLPHGPLLALSGLATGLALWARHDAPQRC
jgi:hypothetical protein